MHAWRALGQLRAEESIETLVGLLPEIDIDGDDWTRDELPTVFGMIGPAALSRLTSYLLDRKNGLWSRIAAGQSLGEIGLQHSESRSDCVDALQEGLKDYKVNDETLNGFLISSLSELKAVEEALLVEKVYQVNSNALASAS